MDIAQAKASTKKWFRRVVIIVPIALVLGVVLYTYVSLHFAYSSGERVGFVQKLSKKGWMCKTNEGELAMVNMAGQQAEIFLFTVPDDAVSKQIEGMGGHRIELSYEEHRGVPSSCFGDTTYFVTAAKETQ